MLPFRHFVRFSIKIMTKLSSFLTAVACTAALGLTACGPSPSASSGEETSADGVRTISITGNDQMQFNIREIKAKPGEKVRIKMSNIGSMPAQTMSHNWVLLKLLDAAGVNAFAMAAASKPNHLPDDQSAIIAHTKMLGPGESDTIEVTAPSEPGSYPYLCTFPGHAALMNGKFIVE